MLLIIAIISINPKSWTTSDVHHFYFEIIAVILSAVVAFYCITRAYTLNDKFSLFIGVGFLTVTVIDFLHAVLSFQAVGNPEFLRYFIPQTWFAGRTFLGAMLVYAVLKYTPTSLSESQLSMDTQNYDENKNLELTQNTKYGEEEKLHASLLFSLVIFAVIAVSVVGVSFFTKFPDIVTNYPLHRPYELPSLLLFALALFYFYKKRLYKINDVFYKGILGALIIDVFGQAIMSYSGTNFDTAHNIPHILKISSLFVIVSSLAISSIQYNRLLKQREKVILDQYQKLKETDKMKDEFINIAAHELRTPIQPILTTAGLLKSKMRNSENDELLDVTVRNAKRLQGLADNILDATKIESNLLKLNLEKVDLNDIILDVLNDHILEERSSNQQKVKIIYQPKSIIVKADRLRMTQVVSNLLGNALKNTQEGSISIIVKNKDDQVTVSVKDTGKGIDRELFPRLFSKFATKSPTGGAGLGLFISRSIIEAHNGKIWAENETSGNFQGAIFTFSLSLKDS